MNGEYPIALITSSLKRLHRPAKLAHHVEEEHDTRSPSVSFHAACSNVSSKTRLLPSDQCAIWPPTRDAELILGLGDEQPEVVSQHALVRDRVCGGMCLPGDRIENIAVSMPGMLSTRRVVSGQRCAVRLALEAVAVEEVRLPPVVVGERRLVGGDVLEVGQVGVVREHVVELAADDLPVGLEVVHPREAGRVVERLLG